MTAEYHTACIFSAIVSEVCVVNLDATIIVSSNHSSMTVTVVDKHTSIDRNSAVVCNEHTIMCFLEFGVFEHKMDSICTTSRL